MSADPEREIVFVYGTLRSGGANHALLRDSRYLGAHRTAPRYTMVDLGPYPGVLPRGRTAIVGELYAVSPAVFAVIDELEDYPRLYTRERITTPHGPAWLYLYRQRALARLRVPDGDWLRYLRQRDAGERVGGGGRR